MVIPRRIREKVTRFPENLTDIRIFLRMPATALWSCAILKLI